MLHVNFNAYNSYVTDSLYQWDINQVLIVTGLNLDSVPEVHFSNANMDRAIARQASLSDGVITVKIPNSVLQMALTIKAYIGVYDGDTFKIVEKIEIPVIPRTRPYDYSFEPNDEEVYSFKAFENSMINALNDITASNNRLETTLLRKYNETKAVADNALAFVTGATQAYVFDTYAKLKSNLSNVNNKGKYSVGNKLYITDTNSPDYWIIEVLTSADTTTGMYYKIAELESEKIDLSDYDYEEITDDELKIIYADLYN